MRRLFVTYDMTLLPLPSGFSYIWGKFCFLFFISVDSRGASEKIFWSDSHSRTNLFLNLECSTIQGLTREIDILDPPESTSRQLCCAWDGRRGSWVLSQSRTRQRSAEMWREIRFRWWGERRPVFGAPQEARDRPPVIGKYINTNPEMKSSY